MPIHDWTRVAAGIFHDFHVAWIAELRRSLNGGILPDGYYALAEQKAGQITPDVLALESIEASADDESGTGSGTAVLSAKPAAALVEALDDKFTYAALQRRIAVKHVCGDRTVALIEVLSPGNKDGPRAVGEFVNKAVGSLQQGLHLLLADGMHAAVWSELGGKQYHRRPGQPLTPAAYQAARPMVCCVNPCSVGSPIDDLPLFLTRSTCVTVPLESTYMAAYAGVPRRWKSVIEAENPAQDFTAETRE